MNITSGTGFTVGRYHAVSEASGVLTLDRAVGTVGSTGGNGTLGGAMASPGACAGAMVGQNTVHWKSGTYTVTTTSSNVSNGIVISPAGAQGNLTTWIGYGTTREDGGAKPKLAADGVITGSVFLFDVNINLLHRVDNIHIDCNSRTSIQGFTSSNRNIISNLKVENCIGTNGINGFGIFTNIEIIACTGTQSGNFTGATVVGLYVDASSNVLLLDSSSLVFFVIDNATGVGITFKANDVNITLVNGVIYSPVGDGVFFNAVRSSLILNVLVEDAGGFSFNGSADTNNVLLKNCGSRNPTTDHTNNVSLGDGGLLEATADFFTDPDNDDFSLNNTAGGGASARAAGFPGVYPGASTTGFLDMGAAQHQDPAVSVTSKGIQRPVFSDSYSEF